MKKSILLGVGLLCSSLAYMPLSSAQDIESLRGTNDIDNASNRVVVKRGAPDREPIQRDYVQQPPLIPHHIKGYKINLRSNKCLTCHSWANYKDAGATKISQTHFADRGGSVHANIAARRYFCVQCHVPQVDAKPLVENTFAPLKTIRR